MVFYNSKELNQKLFCFAMLRMGGPGFQLVSGTGASKAVTSSFDLQAATMVLRPLEADNKIEWGFWPFD